MPGKIIVVDDDGGILKTVKAILEKEGHEVIIADSGQMCLEILENEKPDLILMDVMMPDMDGWETVQKIRGDESNRNVVISMLTVKSRPEDKLKSLHVMGADWHLIKPITRESILQTVEWLLQKSEQKKSMHTDI